MTSSRPHSGLGRPDHSVLRPSCAATVTGMKQAFAALTNGSKEVKDVLLHECNLVYECKVCFSMFRSITNLIAHKRSFCRLKHRNVRHVPRLDGGPPKQSAERVVVVQPEPVETIVPERHWDLQDYSPSLELLKEAGILAEIQEEPLVKSLLPPEDKANGKLHDIVKRLRKKQDATVEENYENSRLLLEPISQSSKAVFQSISGGDGLTMGQRYVDLQKALKLETALIGPDGRVIEPGPLIGSHSPKSDSSKENHNNGNKNSSSSRLQYPCPVCKRLFTRLYNVVSHLEKSHDFSKGAAIKTRTRIMKKAYMMRAKSGSSLNHQTNLVKVSKTSHRGKKPVVRMKRLLQSEIDKWTEVEEEVVVDDDDDDDDDDDPEIIITSPADKRMRLALDSVARTKSLTVNIPRVASVDELLLAVKHSLVEDKSPPLKDEMADVSGDTTATVVSTRKMMPVDTSGGSPHKLWPKRTAIVRVATSSPFIGRSSRSSGTSTPVSNSSTTSSVMDEVAYSPTTTTTTTTTTTVPLQVDTSENKLPNKNDEDEKMNVMLNQQESHAAAKKQKCVSPKSDVKLRLKATVKMHQNLKLCERHNNPTPTRTRPKSETATSNKAEEDEKKTVKPNHGRPMTTRINKAAPASVAKNRELRLLLGNTVDPDDIVKERSARKASVKSE